MKATAEQIEEQKHQLNELFKRAKFEKIYEEDLLEDLKGKLSIFSMCMERTAANNFDQPSKEELMFLSEYWHELGNNILAALDILEMAEYTANGFHYDPHEKANFLNYTSLVERFWLNKSERETAE